MNKDNNDDNLQIKEAQPEYNKLYTYADYITWPDDERWEIIEGIPIKMDSPTVQHQAIAGELHLQLGNYLKGKKCNAYFAPFDVRLNAETTDNTVVQPDLLVICDESIMMKTGCKGAPDMVIEILSPSTSHKDKSLKFNAYQKAGVREFWIVDPDDKLTITHILDNGRYYIKIYQETEKAPVHILPGFEIDLKEIFN